MIHLTHDEKIQMMSSLNWDYLDNYEDMLAVIEGRLESSGAFNREKLFVRSLERLPWHYVTALWGVETIKELYTPEIAEQISPKEMKSLFDFSVSVLRGEKPEAPYKWGDKFWEAWGLELPRHQMFMQFEKLIQF
jgi:hypothetical protein